MIDPLIIPLVAIGGTVLVIVVCVGLHYWSSAHQSESDSRLKMDMLARGLSVADIERVLLASSQPPAPPPQPERISDNEYALIVKMLDDDKPLEEIDRLMRTLRGEEGPGLVADVIRSRNVTRSV